MNYKIIQDLEEFRLFVDWLPELTEDQKYYLCLLARRKYCKDIGVDISADRCQLKRVLATKKNIERKIRQLETEVGTYYAGDTVIPQEGLALYITINPRCMKKALQQCAKKFLDMLCNENHGFNIHAEAMSCVQISKSKVIWQDFDIDLKEDEFLDFDFISELLEPDSYRLLETRGGYHILVDHAKVIKNKKTYYKQLAKISDTAKDGLTPVPGCVQSTFIPNFVK